MNLQESGKLKFAIKTTNGEVINYETDYEISILKKEYLIRYAEHKMLPAPTTIYAKDWFDAKKYCKNYIMKSLFCTNIEFEAKTTKN